ncbi:sigma-54 dependent transcriptional regulator [Bacillus sp. PK3_68]|uniref:sigma-54 interaction domain-containing protein n=1 Tax=Bacillus sp. PK3_68 TaxID=2027408 RepID=UPI00160356BA|nr:sigma-54 dependent transcriptional regulator [Bacillus sp. PK3_68]
MIKNIQANDKWIVHTIRTSNEGIFNSAQINLFYGFFDEKMIDIIQSIVEKRLKTLEDNDLVHLDIQPLGIIIFKQGSKMFIAVSSREEGSPYLTREKRDDELDTAFITRSANMKEVLEVIKKVSFVDSTILLLGESGVGKSMVAKLIHKYSSRSNHPFLSVNCGAIPEPLMEAELFGYTNGSFTGGKKGGKKGIFESANEGIVFLDEIGELPLNMQVKLLEVLQEHCIRPIGAVKQIPINIRVIAATNRNLLELVKQKKFREDLYYRLNVVPIEIPPLRERTEDIIYLARHFLKQKASKYGIFKTFHPEAEESFTHYAWPGNVRELENIIERLTITTEDNEIRLQHLPPFFQSLTGKTKQNDEQSTLMPLKQAKEMVEKELIMKAYTLYQSTYKAAKALGVDQSTIVKKLKRFREEGREE